MRIINQSGVTLTLNGHELGPTQECFTAENMFNTQAIHSDIGSVEITTEYGKRSFECFGQLTAYEDEHTIDSNGLPHIVIDTIERKADADSN